MGTLYNYLSALMLGVVQGLTEFLPVSSSGHLVVFKSLALGDMTTSDLSYEVLLHIGTLAAVIAAYWGDIKQLVLELCTLPGQLVKGKPSKRPESRRLILLVVIATLPLFPAMLIKGQVEKLYALPIVVGCMLIATAAILFLADRIKKGNKQVRHATFWDALIIGLAQVVALVPGISRSGATITGGLARGFSRELAVKFSFLMSIPAILGSAVLVIRDAVKAGSFVFTLPHAVGMITAAVTGFFAIRLVRYIASKDKFGGFAIYCAIAGVVVIVLNVI